MYKSSFFNCSFIIFIISIIFIVFSFSTTISVISTTNEITLTNGNIIVPENYIINFSNSKFLWPTPNNKVITSYFGKRNAPTSGASTYHSGIDIGAPERNKNTSCFFWNCNICWF